jgi:spore coat protein H
MNYASSIPVVFGALLTLAGGLRFATPSLGQTTDAQTTSSAPGADLFHHGTVHRVHLDLDLNATDSLRQHPREFVEATLSEEKSVYAQVGIHLKGAVGSFRAMDDQPSFTLDFSRFKAGQKFHGLRRIHLNNSLEDPSYVNEKIGSELFTAAGVPAPRVTYALVTLNGRNLGLYVLKEGFTEDFLACHFKQVGGDLYEPAGGGDIDQHLKRLSLPIPGGDQASLNALAAAVTEPDLTKRWQSIAALLDTNRFLSFMAMEVMLGHRDGYCLARNNFRVYYDVDTRKIVFFPHGMDQLLGTPDLPWQPKWAGLVAAGIMATPEGKQLYETTFRSIYTKVFLAASLTSRVDQIIKDLRPVLPARDWARLHRESMHVKERINLRQLSLMAQLNSPPVTLMNFEAGFSRLDGWVVSEKPTQGKMDQITTSEGKPALHISAGAETAASWSTRALLQRGRYRFEGQSRVAAVQPLPFGAQPGARLRVRGVSGQGNSLVGDSTWCLLTTQFQVQEATQEVEFFCELRARAGEVWFDVNSLRVTRIGDL